MFFKQLEMCGVEYFDYYLLHALSAKVYKKVSACSAFEVVRQLKQEGRIRHIGKRGGKDEKCVLAVAALFVLMPRACYRFDFVCLMRSAFRCR